MEREYKWMIPQETIAALADFLHRAQTRLAHDMLHMAAIYYDTEENLVYKNGAALRIRQENDRSVCCMKRTVKKQGAQALREEYEVEAATIAEGLQKLPAAGAPQDLCELLAKQSFRELGRTEFVRTCYLLEIKENASFTAEFAVDVGSLGCPGKMQPFEELELELKSGDTAAFIAYADMLEQKFALIPQKRSKLARAIEAAGTAR